MSERHRQELEAGAEELAVNQFLLEGETARRQREPAVLAALAALVHWA